MPESRLPTSESDWKGRMGGPLVSIFNFPSPASASKISLQQFLHLQIYWTKAKSEAPLFSAGRELLIKPEQYNRAKKDLDGAEFWTGYLCSILKHGASTLNTGAFPQIGTFSLVRHFQAQCEGFNDMDLENCLSKVTPISKRLRRPPPSESPTRLMPETPNESMQQQLAELNLNSDLSESPSSNLQSSSPLDYSPALNEVDLPAVKDEQIVNTALILFLTAVTMHFDIPADWSLHRERFVFGESGTKLFEARVDGYLWSRRNRQKKAIIEVKPVARTSNLDAIRMQEAAQMAAWICSSPDKDPKPKQKFK
jgi:hypothetical protein